MRAASGRKPPDAVLHHALGDRGAQVGVLVAAVHPAAVFHGARAGPIGQVRGLYAGRGVEFPEPAQLGTRLERGRQQPAGRHRHQPRRRRAAKRNQHRRRRCSAGHA
ncbi:hypothetical protein G6F65_022077 [Rhizopus arrhizus]|nr:hypothetical protein G6F65_022077 [Rhizopus arrhizus]